ncbi:MAG: menaquinol oxidoreductase, partial [Deltaproteobacteria bacterium]|nr:menaquinol oxidoreductase [Deltaproteobacteria bacterium]
MNVIISILFSSVAVGLVVLIPWVGVGVFDLGFLFGVIVPYGAIVIFFGGVILRVLDWARSPVPFRIPTTAGQQWTLPWIKSSPVDNPKG